MGLIVGVAGILGFPFGADMAGAGPAGSTLAYTLDLRPPEPQAILLMI